MGGITDGWPPVKFENEESDYVATVLVALVATGATFRGDYPSTEKLLSRFKPGVATMIVIEGAGHNDIQKNKKYRETLQTALE